MRKTTCIASPKKVRYPSERKARQAASLQMWRDKEVPDLHAYKCSSCGGWHLTSKARL